MSDEFKSGFFDACKDVQFGATNSYSMDLIGGGAKDGQAFLSYMGKERPGLGSPFQINFPRQDSMPSDQGFDPLNPSPLSCSDYSRLDSRCTCADCPSICPSLPPLAPPPPAHQQPSCHVGHLSCGAFTIVLIYSVGVLALLTAYILQATMRARARRYERVALDEDGLGEAAPMSPTGISQQGPYFNTEQASSYSSSHRRRDGSQNSNGGVGYPSSGQSGESGGLVGRGASLLDPREQLQPRRSRINVALKQVFYKLGLFCASKPCTSSRPSAKGAGELTLTLLSLHSPHSRHRCLQYRTPQFRLEVLRRRDGSRSPLGRARVRGRRAEDPLRPKLWTLLPTSASFHHVGVGFLPSRRGRGDGRQPGPTAPQPVRTRPDL